MDFQVSSKASEEAKASSSSSGPVAFGARSRDHCAMVLRLTFLGMALVMALSCGGRASRDDDANRLADRDADENKMIQGGASSGGTGGRESASVGGTPSTECSADAEQRCAETPLEFSLYDYDGFVESDYPFYLAIRIDDTWENCVVDPSAEGWSPCMKYAGPLLEPSDNGLIYRVESGDGGYSSITFRSERRAHEITVIPYEFARSVSEFVGYPQYAPVCKLGLGGMAGQNDNELTCASLVLEAIIR